MMKSFDRTNRKTMVAAPEGGRPRGRASSNSAATRSERLCSPGRAASWIAGGIPAAAKPKGRLIAGLPVRLNRIVRGSQAAAPCLNPTTRLHAFSAGGERLTRSSVPPVKAVRPERRGQFGGWHGRELLVWHEATSYLW